MLLQMLAIEGYARERENASAAIPADEAADRDWKRGSRGADWTFP